uniref:Ig-like domain-containing protein n=1 Tax=Oryzias latipes TaxID=8090 RepID=H2MUH9_ORYLA
IAQGLICRWMHQNRVKEFTYKLSQLFFSSASNSPGGLKKNKQSFITWQKTIKGKAPNDVFLTIQPTTGVKYSNGQDLRFEFIGNVNDKNGTLKFSNVTLKDEGSYTCIFSLFPSGTQSRISQLVILVPPITNLMDHTPLEGNEEVPLATCTAAASKPKAEVRWIKGSLEGKVREELNETQHANGTTTTWSTLLGKPGREMNGQLVKCVISTTCFWFNVNNFQSIWSGVVSHVNQTLLIRPELF